MYRRPRQSYSRGVWATWRRGCFHQHQVHDTHLWILCDRLTRISAVVPGFGHSRRVLFVSKLLRSVWYWARKYLSKLHWEWVCLSNMSSTTHCNKIWSLDVATIVLEFLQRWLLRVICVTNIRLQYVLDVIQLATIVFELLQRWLPRVICVTNIGPQNLMSFNLQQLFLSFYKDDYWEWYALIQNTIAIVNGLIILSQSTKRHDGISLRHVQKLL